jgi:hypothetical protein
MLEKWLKSVRPSLAWALAIMDYPAFQLRFGAQYGTFAWSFDLHFESLRTANSL